MSIRPGPHHLPLALALIAVIAVLGEPAAASTSEHSRSEANDPVEAAFSQMGRKLIFSLTTATPVALSELQPFPQSPSRVAYLCVSLSLRSRPGERRLCFGGHSPKRQMGLSLINRNGMTSRRASLDVRITRPEPKRLVASLLPTDAGLGPDRYRWRVLGGPSCPAGIECINHSLPAEGFRTLRLRPVHVVGCTGGSAGLDTNGSRQHKVLALTFDDGPSVYTPSILNVLRAHHVPGTFFEVGQEMAGREAMMRRILAEGDEIGDHTMNHIEYPGHAQIAGAAARIAAITDFRPCLFRPPGGALNSSVVATAGALGMRTITWDVDPRDWSLPGTGAIYERILGASRPGSIILMHDGGGNRSETLAALPEVIATLRARGYSFATVTQLLGQRMIYRPYG